MIDKAINHIAEVARIPSFSSYEERLHPYIRKVFKQISRAEELEVEGNNLLFRVGNKSDNPTIALAAHLDKINHYGEEYPDALPVTIDDEQIEGAMDDSAGVGLLLAMAARAAKVKGLNFLFFFSEMEESKGLKEHPELLRDHGKGYRHGMGARRIARHCLSLGEIPAEVITLDTTPLFKGEPGIALYSKHWEYNDLNPSDDLVKVTEEAVDRFVSVDAHIRLDNNTNDYLQYGLVFNQERGGSEPVVSVALEPAIYPYHQKGERVFISDLQRTLDILEGYTENYPR